MMKIPDSGRGLVRRLALAAGAILVLSAAFGERADALSLINPGAAHAAKQVSEGLATEVHGGHGGGGHGGGGHGGGGYHGGGFHGGGYHTAHVFRGGGFRHGGFAFRHHHRHFFYGPGYYDDYPYYYPYRRCHIVWTHYGPRRVCHFRHWRPHYWHRHHHHRHHRSW
jgi:hypothetical protein